jgi:predicted TPR repeat methyltransferase
MIKNLKTKVSKYYQNQNDKLSFSVPSETIFRLLGNYKFNYLNKNCLDIGIGSGDNLLEFKRRKANIFGIDIRKNIINKFVNTHRLNKKNFFICDLNKSFPDINKMDLILMKDILYYIELERQFEIFKIIYQKLKKNGLFLFQYIQKELKLRNKNFFQYNILKNYSKLKNYHEEKNPISFLEDRHITKLIKSQKFQIINSIFDINTHCKDNTLVVINRFILLKKKLK